MQIGFGGGCHWCTEAVYQSLMGVSDVRQGFIASDAPHDSYSEAVLVEYAPEQINVSILIEIHLRTHASSSAHKMRGKYRSAIYILDDSFDKISAILAKLRGDFEKDLITQILPFCSFKSSDERFQNYYENGPEKPFCTNYIDPKLAMLRKDFSKYYSRD